MLELSTWARSSRELPHDGPHHHRSVVRAKELVRERVVCASARGMEAAPRSRARAPRARARELSDEIESYCSRVEFRPVVSRTGRRV